MRVDIIRDELRESPDNSLKRRRWIAFLSALGLVDFSIISLYQMGFIRHLPDLPGKLFDSDKVNAADDAYQFGMPDGPISAGIYSLNLILGSYKGDQKSGRPLMADLALAGSVLGNAAGAAVYLKNMISKQKKVCPYCILGALINFASVPFAAIDIYQKISKKINLQNRQKIIIA